MSASPRRGRRQPAQTPVRAALKAESFLRSSVKDGLGAIENSHRDYFDVSIRTSFADSLDVDSGLKAGHEQENRWDYLLGHAPTGNIIGVEPHSAKEDEVSTVIRKLRSARDQLHDHLRDGVKVSRWIWVASGGIQFLQVGKTRFELAQAGIHFAGRRVKPKDLP